MSEKIPEPKEKTQEHWKNGFRVTVFCGASSPKSLQDVASASVENGYELGKLLAEEGLDAANGGYSLGTMDAMAKGFKDECKTLGVPDDEVKKHLFGEILSEEVVGKNFASNMPVIEGETTQAHDLYSDRIGELINSSQVHVALEGGMGTAIESMLAAMSEWVHQKKETAIVKPLIVIDSRNTFANLLRDIETRTPGSIKTLNEHTYILSGHSNPNIKKPGHERELDVATLANDSHMKEQVRLLLRFFAEQIKDQPDAAELQKMKEVLFDPKSSMKILTLKEWLNPADSYEI